MPTLRKVSYNVAFNAFSSAFLFDVMLSSRFNVNMFGFEQRISFYSVLFLLLVGLSLNVHVFALTDIQEGKQEKLHTILYSNQTFKFVAFI